jgi:hypothetical protein
LIQPLLEARAKKSMEELGILISRFTDLYAAKSVKFNVRASQK